ncbi:MAG: hypothetical protein PUB52_10930 [Lachnospiraceae bacterium]|nr:hypothetical protein [Lachnospiraceae bacterium]
MEQIGSAMGLRECAAGGLGVRGAVAGGRGGTAGNFIEKNDGHSVDKSYHI